MPSAARIVEDWRQEEMNAALKKYLGEPPKNAELIEARLVIAGEHLIPEGLDQPENLNIIRAKYETWITSDDSQTFSLSSHKMPSLQKAIKALNELIHDLRLSGDQRTRILVQLPSIIRDNDTRISLILNTRPTMSGGKQQLGARTDEEIVNGIMLDVGRDLPVSAEYLMCLGKNLQMSVSFGRLIISSKKRSTGSEFSYDEFKRVLAQGSVRGAAKLATELADTPVAERVLNALSDPVTGIRHASEQVRMKDTFTLIRNGQEKITAEIVSKELVGMIARRHEEWPRLDWTVASPDRHFDWCFRVSAWEEFGLSEDLRTILQRLSFNETNSRGSLEQKLLRPSVSGLILLKDKVNEVQVKRSALIPFDSEPYEVEVSVTQSWKELTDSRATSPPEVTWGLQLHGISWEEAVNNVGPDSRKKDWGEACINVWPGNGGNLQERFGSFLRCILNVQHYLDNALEPVDLLA